MNHKIGNIAKKVIRILAAAVLCAGGAYGQTFTVLHGFTGGADGGPSYSTLTPDSAGNLYGTTVWGGSTNCEWGCGVVFELTPASGGGYSESAIYSFQGGADGWSPDGKLVFDGAGNLYGATNAGGPHNGAGAVFELTPSAGGWTKSVLYQFPGGNHGGSPTGVAFDASGNLYGNASADGAHNYGLVFQLTPGSGGWTQHVIHAFTGGNDGALPYGNITVDSSGNVYGTTINGGAHGHGIVYQFKPQGDGTWKEVVAHSFTGGIDGAEPSGGVVLDASGDIYGVTNYGGNTGLCTGQGPGCGVVFKITPSGSGWTESVIHTFTGGEDGSFPQAQLIFDSAGDIYGTAAYGGSVSICPFTIGCGTVFELSPQSGGKYSVRSLHRFSNGADGAEPVGALYLDASGNLFGTASAGASTACLPTGGCGTIFEISGLTAHAQR